MPWGYAIGAVVSAGANKLMNSGGSSSASNGSPNAYVPQNQAGVDNNWNQMMTNLSGTAGNQQALTGPYMNAAFGNTANLYNALGAQMGQYGNILEGQAGAQYGAGQNLRNAGDQVWQSSLDPQQALYNRMLQQTQDQSRASTSMRGIGMSPQAAGLENQSVGDFNMNWQNQQLQRQLSGLQGMGGAYGQAGNLSGLAGQDLAGAQAMFQGAGQLPFNLAQMYGQGMNSNIYAPQAGLQGNMAQYLGLGQSGSQNAFNQGQTNMNNWATLGGQIGKYFGKQGSTGGNNSDGSGTGGGDVWAGGGWGEG